MQRRTDEWLDGFPLFLVFLMKSLYTDYYEN